MGDPTGAIGPLSKLIGAGVDYYEFWKNYKGEEILIRDHSVEIGQNDSSRGSVRQNTHIIRGRVADVTSYPPGFLLEDVEEYVKLSDLRFRYGQDVEPVDVVPGNKGRQTLRRLDEKYVSFSKIDELERAEAADIATEPFRDSNQEE